MKLNKLFWYILILFSIITTSYASLTNSSKSANQPQKSEIEYLFIQTAKLGELHYDEVNHRYTLLLHKADPWTIYFSNVPKHETGFVLLKEFLVSFEKEIKKDHPRGLNAGLVAFDIKTQKRIRHTFSLSQPEYDSVNQTISFAAYLLPGEQESPHVDMIFEHVAVFIDSCASCGGSDF